MESDRSEGSAPPTPARQGSITLNHQESDEEVEEEMDEDFNEESYGDEGSLSEDATDGVCFSANTQLAGARSSSSGSFEEMRSPSPDGSLDQSSSVSEDVEELEGSLDGSQGSSHKQRSLSVLKHRMHHNNKSLRAYRLLCSSPDTTTVSFLKLKPCIIVKLSKQHLIRNWLQSSTKVIKYD